MWMFSLLIRSQIFVFVFQNPRNTIWKHAQSVNYILTLKNNQEVLKFNMHHPHSNGLHHSHSNGLHHPHSNGLYHLQAQSIVLQFTPTKKIVMFLSNKFQAKGDKKLYFFIIAHICLRNFYNNEINIMVVPLAIYHPVPF